MYKTIFLNKPIIRLTFRLWIVNSVIDCTLRNTSTKKKTCWLRCVWT